MSSASDGLSLHGREHLEQLPAALQLGPLALAHRDRDGRELLTDVVVQIAGNPRPFRLLRGDETASKVFDFFVTLTRRGLIGTQRLLGLTTLGDVDARPDVAEKSAVGGEPGHTRVEHPSVFAIRLQQAVLHPERLPAWPRGGVDR
jgi:hypothetical protein